MVSKRKRGEASRLSGFIPGAFGGTPDRGSAVRVLADVALDGGVFTSIEDPARSIQALSQDALVP